MSARLEKAGPIHSLCPHLPLSLPLHCFILQSQLQTQLMTLKTEMDEAKAQGTQMGAENGALTGVLGRRRAGQYWRWELCRRFLAMQITHRCKRHLLNRT